MTNAEKIVKYLKKRKNATYPEISKATGIGYESVKRTANKHSAWNAYIRSENLTEPRIRYSIERKCRVTGKIRNAYALA